MIRALTPVLCLLGALLLQGAASSSPPSPVDVVFSSVNLRNVVEWRPGNDTPPGTHFLVQYAIYGDSVENGKDRRVNWRPVQHCQYIGRSWCDLTNETGDLEHGYYARVRAVNKKRSSKWTQTQRRFEPKSDTRFGPPMVSVAMEENWAIVNLKGPMRYQPDNHTQEVSMATFYPKQITYNVSVRNVRRNQTHHFPVLHNEYKHQLIDYETEYCFSATARFLAMPVSCQASPWHCISTPQDPLIGQLHRVVVGIVVPSVCVCMLVVTGYLLYRSVRGTDHKTPRVLVDMTSLPPLTFDPENPKLLLLTINNKHLSVSSTSLSYPTLTQQHHPNPALPDLLSYARQRPFTPQEMEEEEPHHHPHWENHLVHPEPAVDYGFVGADEAIAPGGGEESGREEEGGSAEEERRDGGSREEAGGGEDDDAMSGGHEREEAGGQMERRTSPKYAPQTTKLRRTAHSPTHSGTRAPQPRVHTEDREGGTDEGIFVKRDPRTGQFRIALPRRAGDDGGMDNEVAGAADGGRGAEAREREEERCGGADGRQEEGTRGEERETLRSPYALQCSQGRPAPRQLRGGQWGDSPVDYAVLTLADEREVEEEDEEEGTNRVDWDPETGRLLVVPRMEETEMVEEERGARLESVLVRQASGVEEEEEEEEVKRRQEEEEGETDALLSRWSLKVHMD